MNMNVIVTGAGSVFGKHLIHELLKDTFTVIAVAKENPNITNVQHLPMDLAVSANYPYFGKEVAVVNCAELFAESRSLKLSKANLLGTMNAMRLGGGRFIHLSTTGIYNMYHDHVNLAERNNLEKSEFVNEYVKTKYEADQLVLSRRRDQPSAVLRPHLLYGLNDDTLFNRTVRKITKNSISLPRWGKSLHTFTHVDNLVQAIKLSLRSELLQDNNAFNIVDSTKISFADALFASQNTEGDLKVHNIPMKFALPLARLTEQVTPVDSEPQMSEYFVRQVGMQRTYETAKASFLLGYRPTESKF